MRCTEVKIYNLKEPGPQDYRLFLTPTVFAGDLYLVPIETPPPQVHGSGVRIDRARDAGKRKRRTRAISR